MSVTDMRNKSYKPLEWEDRVLDVDTGEVLVEGTPVNEVNLNRLESGIMRALYDMGVTNAEGLKILHDVTGELDKNRKQRVLQGQATITTSKEPYFRNADAYVLVSLPTGSYPQRNAPNYDVQLNIISADDAGLVGELVVYDKAQNGFKVKMTGSAGFVTFMWTLINPRIN